jgi:hypothetical protein
MIWFVSTKTCHYRPQTCPVNKLLVVKCDWTGIYKQVKGHLMEELRGYYFKYVDRKFRTPKKIAVPMYLNQFVLALNEIF